MPDYDKYDYSRLLEEEQIIKRRILHGAGEADVNTAELRLVYEAQARKREAALSPAPGTQVEEIRQSER